MSHDTPTRFDLPLASKPVRFNLDTPTRDIAGSYDAPTTIVNVPPEDADAITLLMVAPSQVALPLAATAQSEVTEFAPLLMPAPASECLPEKCTVKSTSELPVVAARRRRSSQPAFAQMVLGGITAASVTTALAVGLLWWRSGADVQAKRAVTTATATVRQAQAAPPKVPPLHDQRRAQPTFQAHEPAEDRTAAKSALVLKALEHLRTGHTAEAIVAYRALAAQESGERAYGIAAAILERKQQQKSEKQAP